MNPWTRNPSPVIRIVGVLVMVQLVVLPWLLGGELLQVQAGAFLLAATSFILALFAGKGTPGVPVALLASLALYVLIQYGNPAFIQEWQTGLRIWTLQPTDHMAWLPSSIRSDFTDASPPRFLMVTLTAGFCGLACYSLDSRLDSRILLPALAGNAALISLAGLIQTSAGSRSILGIFPAADEGLGLFFGTLLYKNHAAAFFNLGLAISLACFFRFSRSHRHKRSSPSGLFLLCAAVLVAGVILSRSRFGFVCSLIIFATFVPLVLTQVRAMKLPGKWLFAGGGALLLLSVAGGIQLSSSALAVHLKTLNANIVEDFSFKQRKLAYEAGLSMFREKPVYGWGAGNFRHGFRQYQQLDAEHEQSNNLHMRRHKLNFFWQHIHNDYLEWFIELGIVGSLLLASIPGYFFWTIFRSKRWKDPVVLMLLAGLASTLTHALLDFPFQNPAILVTWFSMLVIAAKRCSGNKRHGDQPEAVADPVA